MAHRKHIIIQFPINILYYKKLKILDKSVKLDKKKEISAPLCQNRYIHTYGIPIDLPYFLTFKVLKFWEVIEYNACSGGLRLKSHEI